MPRALFVCTANTQRSPTAQDLFQDWQGIWETKSAGIMPVTDGIPVTQELIDWADAIIVMEPTHSRYIQALFQPRSHKIHILHIADRYFRDDPELIRQLRKKVPRILEKYVSYDDVRKRESD